jgi:dolichol-phosphate mannosyltransferase
MGAACHGARSDGGWLAPAPRVKKSCRAASEVDVSGEDLLRQPVRARNPTIPAASAATVSVIVPTYLEADNVPVLVGRLKAVAAAHQLRLELLIVDDDSGDDVAALPARLGEESWVRVIVRHGRRDLGQAVVEGMRAALGDVLVVMDADLSHPPETIPALLAALARPDVDFVLASRYVAGGSTYDEWGALARLNSWIARAIARPLVPVEDPMSGFFALRRSTFVAARELDPLGYKIALELIVKCNCTGVSEVPIHFGPRLHGKSKLGARARIDYLRHVKRLVDYRYGGVLALIGAVATRTAPAAIRRP